MGVGVEKNLKQAAPKIKESEVTREAISTMNIEEILDHIGVYEAAI